jgi:hypothetical protein
MNQLVNKPIGQILQEAGLINTAQLNVALANKKLYPHLKLGEIVVLHGWLKQETADFFAEEIKQIESNQEIAIGECFYQAALLTQQDIDKLLLEQRNSGVEFTSVAVKKGLIKQKTMNFFSNYFMLEQQNQKILTKQNQIKQKRTINFKTLTDPWID